MAVSDIKPMIFAASVTCLEDSGVYAAAYSMVSSKRREKADKYRFEKDRYLSLGAELLLRYGLHTVGADVPMDFEYGDQNKPYLKNGNVFFSISHSGDYAVCAIAGCEIGCDIEKIVPVDQKIPRRFFTHREYEDIAAQPGQAERNDAFFRYWTLKESFMKVTGLGMSLPLNSFEIKCGEAVSVIHTVDDRDYSFAEFRDIPGYRCAMCTAGDCRDARLSIVNLAETLRVN